MAQARTRPRYGDTLRVETHTVVMSGDSTPDALAGLVFETLVTVDDNGHLQPGLATSWASSNNASRWEFSLRHGVTFQDGTPFDSSYVIACLSKLNNQAWRVRGSSRGVVFEADIPQPNLPALLSLPQYAISSTSSGGDPVGTGPFRVDHRAGSLISLKANDDYWGGRPFVDALELTTSRPLRDQATDFSFDRADVVELSPEQLRRSQQDRLRLDISKPAETIFLVFDSPKPELRDQRLRQAISLAIDRAAIHNVIFQHQGEIASGLLPNWLSGYEFLFSGDQDLAHARQLRLELGQLPTINIGYDAGDATERLIAERVALNAHDAGINMQALPNNSAMIDIRIRRVALPSLDPAAALSVLIDRLGIVVPDSSSSSLLFANERAALQTYTAIPLVHLPHVTALKDRIRDWDSSPGGNWHLESLWLTRNLRSEAHP